MEAKQQLKEMAKRLEKAFSIYDYDYVIETDALTYCIQMRFSSSTDVVSPSAVESFRRVVGEVGVEIWDNHLVLFGFPLLY